MPYADPVKRAECKRRWVANNRAKHRANCKRWRDKNPDKVAALRKAYWERHKVRLTVIIRNWRLRNIDRARATTNAYKRRLAQTPEGRAMKSCRDRVYKAIKRGDKVGRTIELIGCTIAEFVAHIERQFVHPMTWQNHGRVWEIDHIKPVASFDHTNPAEQRACFHFSNCRPLLSPENKRKGARF